MLGGSPEFFGSPCNASRRSGAWVVCSIDIHHFIRAQQDLGVLFPARHFAAGRFVQESEGELQLFARRFASEQQPIRSRWQHDAVPTWRPVTPTAVVEVAFTLLDGGRWLRQPARFVRWRLDRSAADCDRSQLAVR